MSFSDTEKQLLRNLFSGVKYAGDDRGFLPGVDQFISNFKTYATSSQYSNDTWQSLLIKLQHNEDSEYVNDLIKNGFDVDVSMVGSVVSLITEKLETAKTQLVSAGGEHLVFDVFSEIFADVVDTYSASSIEALSKYMGSDLVTYENMLSNTLKFNLETYIQHQIKTVDDLDTLYTWLEFVDETTYINDMLPDSKTLLTNLSDELIVNINAHLDGIIISNDTNEMLVSQSEPDSLYMQLQSFDWSADKYSGLRSKLSSMKEYMLKSSDVIFAKELVEITQGSLDSSKAYIEKLFEIIQKQDILFFNKLYEISSDNGVNLGSGKAIQTFMKGIGAYVGFKDFTTDNPYQELLRGVGAQFGGRIDDIMDALKEYITTEFAYSFSGISSDVKLFAALSNDVLGTDFDIDVSDEWDLYFSYIMVSHYPHDLASMSQDQLDFIYEYSQIDSNKISLYDSVAERLDQAIVDAFDSSAPNLNLSDAQLIYVSKTVSFDATGKLQSSLDINPEGVVDRLFKLAVSDDGMTLTAEIEELLTSVLESEIKALQGAPITALPTEQRSYAMMVIAQSLAVDSSGDGLSSSLKGVLNRHINELYAEGKSLDSYDAYIKENNITFTKVTGAGDDTLTGTKYSETLIGGAGDDVFLSSGGKDTFIGGEGADTFTAGFLYAANNYSVHTVKDYHAEDTIKFDSNMGYFMLFETGTGIILYNYSYEDMYWQGLYLEDFDAGMITLEFNDQKIGILNFEDGNTIHLDHAALAHIVGLDTLYHTDSLWYAYLAGGRGLPELYKDPFERLYELNSESVTINVTKVNGEVKYAIHGTDADETLAGTAGSNIFMGGKGADTFIVDAGYYPDTIADYEAIDTIKIDADGTYSYVQLMDHGDYVALYSFNYANYQATRVFVQHSGEKDGFYQLEYNDAKIAYVDAAKGESLSIAKVDEGYQLKVGDHTFVVDLDDIDNIIFPRSYDSAGRSIWLSYQNEGYYSKQIEHISDKLNFLHAEVGASADELTVDFTTSGESIFVDTTGMNYVFVDQLYLEGTSEQETFIINSNYLNDFRFKNFNQVEKLIITHPDGTVNDALTDQLLYAIKETVGDSGKDAIVTQTTDSTGSATVSVEVDGVATLYVNLGVDADGIAEFTIDSGMIKLAGTEITDTMDTIIIYDSTSSAQSYVLTSDDIARVKQAFEEGFLAEVPRGDTGTLKFKLDSESNKISSTYKPSDVEFDYANPFNAALGLSGDDEIHAGNFYDSRTGRIFEGGRGEDTLYSSAKSETFAGNSLGASSSDMAARAEVDTFVFESKFGHDTIYDFYQDVLKFNFSINNLSIKVDQHDADSVIISFGGNDDVRLVGYSKDQSASNYIQIEGLDADGKPVVQTFVPGVLGDAPVLLQSVIDVAVLADNEHINMAAVDSGSSYGLYNEISNYNPRHMLQLTENPDTPLEFDIDGDDLIVTATVDSTKHVTVLKDYVSAARATGVDPILSLTLADKNVLIADKSLASDKFYIKTDSLYVDGTTYSVAKYDELYFYDSIDGKLMDDAVIVLTDISDKIELISSLSGTEINPDHTWMIVEFIGEGLDASASFKPSSSYIKYVFVEGSSVVGTGEEEVFIIQSDQFDEVQFTNYPDIETVVILDADGAVDHKLSQQVEAIGEHYAAQGILDFTVTSLVDSDAAVILSVSVGDKTTLYVDFDEYTDTVDITTSAGKYYIAGQEIADAVDEIYLYSTTNDTKPYVINSNDLVKIKQAFDDGFLLERADDEVGTLKFRIDHDDNRIESIYKPTDLDVAADFVNYSKQPFGLSGDDEIYAADYIDSRANRKFEGGAGEDTLYSSRMADRFAGNVFDTASVDSAQRAEVDTFVFDEHFGQDTIYDFYQDVLRFNLPLDKMSFSVSPYDANDLVISFSDYDTVTLKGYNADGSFSNYVTIEAIDDEGEFATYTFTPGKSYTSPLVLSSTDVVTELVESDHSISILNDLPELSFSTYNVIEDYDPSYLIKLGHSIGAPLVFDVQDGDFIIIATVDGIEHYTILKDYANDCLVQGSPPLVSFNIAGSNLLLSSNSLQHNLTYIDGDEFNLLQVNNDRIYSVADYDAMYFYDDFNHTSMFDIKLDQIVDGADFRELPYDQFGLNVHVNSSGSFITSAPTSLHMLSADSDYYDINSSALSSTVFSGEGDDVVSIRFSENITLYGNEGEDDLYVYASDNVTLRGGEGADKLASSNSSAILEGGSGDDELSVVGEESQDVTNILTGGLGTDVFKVDVSVSNHASHVEITDLSLGYDRLVLSCNRGDGSDDLVFDVFDLYDFKGDESTGVFDEGPDYFGDSYTLFFDTTFAGVWEMHPRSLLAGSPLNDLDMKFLQVGENGHDLMIKIGNVTGVEANTILIRNAFLDKSIPAATIGDFTGEIKVDSYDNPLDFDFPIEEISFAIDPLSPSDLIITLSDDQQVRLAGYDFSDTSDSNIIRISRLGDMGEKVISTFVPPEVVGGSASEILVSAANIDLSKVELIDNSFEFTDYIAKYPVEDNTYVLSEYNHDDVLAFHDIAPLEFKIQDDDLVISVESNHKHYTMILENYVKNSLAEGLPPILSVEVDGVTYLICDTSEDYLLSLTKNTDGYLLESNDLTYQLTKLDQLYFCNDIDSFEMDHTDSDAQLISVEDLLVGAGSNIKIDIFNDKFTVLDDKYEFDLSALSVVNIDCASLSFVDNVISLDEYISDADADTAFVLASYDPEYLLEFGDDMDSPLRFVSTETDLVILASDDENDHTIILKDYITKTSSLGLPPLVSLEFEDEYFLISDTKSDYDLTYAVDIDGPDNMNLVSIGDHEWEVSHSYDSLIFYDDFTNTSMFDETVSHEIDASDFTSLRSYADEIVKLEISSGNVKIVDIDTIDIDMVDAYADPFIAFDDDDFADSADLGDAILTYYTIKYYEYDSLLKLDNIDPDSIRFKINDDNLLITAVDDSDSVKVFVLHNYLQDYVDSGDPVALSLEVEGTKYLLAFGVPGASHEFSYGSDADAGDSVFSIDGDDEDDLPEYDVLHFYDTLEGVITFGEGMSVEETRDSSGNLSYTYETTGVSTDDISDPEPPLDDTPDEPVLSDDGREIIRTPDDDSGYFEAHPNSIIDSGAGDDGILVNGAMDLGEVDIKSGAGKDKTDILLVDAHSSKINLIDFDASDDTVTILNNEYKFKITNLPGTIDDEALLVDKDGDGKWELNENFKYKDDADLKSHLHLSQGGDTGHDLILEVDNDTNDEVDTITVKNIDLDDSVFDDPIGQPHDEPDDPTSGGGGV